MKHTGPDHWLKEKTRLFAAADTSDIVAYIETADTAENFVTEVPQIQNICGAFCLPAYRGKGLYPNLLNFLIASLAIEGYTLLGVVTKALIRQPPDFGENILLPIPAAWFVALMKMYWPSKKTIRQRRKHFILSAGGSSFAVWDFYRIIRFRSPFIMLASSLFQS